MGPTSYQERKVVSKEAVWATRHGKRVQAHRGRRAEHEGSGVPWERGRPCRIRLNSGEEGSRNPVSWPSVSCAQPPREQNNEHKAVPPSEGNEARREVRQGVIAPEYYC